MSGSLQQQYGKLALIAGASEGIGAAFAHRLAREGLDLVLVARKEAPLRQLASEISSTYGVVVDAIPFDLSLPDAPEQLLEAISGKEISILVYNAALSFISPFEKNNSSELDQLTRTNMITPVHLVHTLGTSMLKKGKGAIILMTSLAGFQGSGFLTAYASTKAFLRILAESLWYEWKDRGVEVIACCAGATSTPGFIKSNPEKKSFFAPRVLRPEEVVQESLDHLGKVPSFIPGRGNRWASFIMQKLLPRKMAIRIMGDTTRKMYRLP
jgi:short-subunit dehydrogenase